MRPQPFADLLKQWLTDADHPAVARVWTCAEVGRHEQPVGVRIDLADGWAFLLQTVRVSPDGGDPPDEAAAAPIWDQDEYRRAREVADREAAAVKPPARGARPQAKVGDLLALVLDVVKRADHPGVTAVEVSARRLERVAVLRVSCSDGSKIFGLPVGFIRPGATDFDHAAHQIPKEYL